MPKYTLLLVAATLSSLSAVPSHAAGSLVRVACEGPDVGAEIFVNGVFKGECPIDFQVAPGSVALKAIKKVDTTRERVFEQQVRVGDGVVKKVDLVLGAPRLNEAAKQRFEQEFARLRQAAEGGDAAAMFSVAYRYEQGRGVPQDDGLANEWYRKAADAGNADAMTNLAFRHQFGKGVARNHGEAAAWYRKAAELGNPTAMNNLAALYLGGQGVARDPAEAIRWLEQAAAAGFADAAATLAFNYATGSVLPKNEALAVEWYRKGADGGSARAMYGLGTMYDSGRGVTTDAGEAVRWYRAAADKGFGQAIEALRKRGLR